MSERHIPLNSCPNFRDLGGYRATDGRTVRWRCLFRSSAVHTLSEEDAQVVKNDLGVSTMIDLRSPVDGRAMGLGRLHEMGVRRHSVPLNDSQHRLPEPTDARIYSLPFVYRWYLSESSSRIRRAIELLADEAAGPTVFHCTAGKDRAGLVAAVVLGILGVSDDQIADDYHLTEPFMPQILSGPGMPSTTLEWFATLTEEELEEINTAPASVMATTLDWLNATNGGVIGYAREIGVDDDTQNRLRDLYLE